MSKKSVTLAYPYTGADGKNHKADTTLSLDVAEANRLLIEGLAREADKTNQTEKKG
jgi:hypothetical protein